MKKTVIAIMGIAIAVIGICVAHGVNDDYVAGQINQMAGQVLIGEVRSRSGPLGYLV